MGGNSNFNTAVDRTIQSPQPVTAVISNSIAAIAVAFTAAATGTPAEIAVTAFDTTPRSPSTAPEKGHAGPRPCM